ncbi:class I SAM-dependent methyltransferase [Pseudaestuariivita atlantica]|uniref:Methyltransferase type 12 n=1 Tax=Pseudaestuariivita atlantica TaxID=1317121 RepID=A0A0L1JMC7_9RHOB|nr:class I SAM-dependent methyltransferase [Pseudaestuariivita atlantica]KNG92909.1 methyltransferase type 12 [Pseudaestuariivita atlantica]
MDRARFFELHRDLPREGPGEAAEVAWATGLAGLPPGAVICDAGCGPGADIGALLEAAPRARVDAVERHPGFVAEARARWADEPRVRVIEGDMGALDGPYDLIWCAGALYFLGVTEGLQAWRGALARGGKVAFSELCWFTADPSEGAREMWAEYPAITDAAGIDARVRAAGYETLDTRVVSDAAWEAYYTPLDARIAALRDGADAALTEVLDAGAREAELWRAHRRECGYLLSLVRPV